VPNVIHFEIGVDDPQGAAAFYSRVFDWKIEQSKDEYWYITTGGDDEDSGIPGGITRRFDELNPTINTIEVGSVDRCARRITEEGGRVLAPKVPIPGEGYVQYCQDLEGNVFGIMEYDAASR
jgi:predicted enzyme related to lactoylglutathione lyase